MSADPSPSRRPGPASAVATSVAEGLARARWWSLLVGAVAIGFLVLLVWADQAKHLQEKRADALAQAGTQVNLIHNRLDGALSATYALAVVLRQHHYQPDYAWFEPFAKELLRYHPGVSNLQYAPDGVTSYIVPLSGNERAIGNNLLLNTQRNKEALQAIATRKLTLAGPFDLLQGGVGMAGRLPIFAGGPTTGDGFWGFAVALIRIEELLRSADIDRLARAGYDYTLWRVHPDSGQPHIFARSGPEQLRDAVELPFDVPNGRWTLSLAPRSGWMVGAKSEYGVKYGLAVVFGLLIGWLSYVLLRQPVFLQDRVARRTEELQRANERLAEENRQREAAQINLKLADKVIESSAEAIMVTDANQWIVRVNKAFTEITGYQPDEVIGRSPSLLNSGRHDAAFFQTMFESLKVQGHWQGEVWNRRKDGEVFPQWLGISVLRDASGAPTHYVSISSDISERKATEERLHYLAHYDALTGLPNRLLLRDRLQQAVSLAERNATRVAVLSLDLDRFKIINDTLGHHVGDELLKLVVARLKQSVRAMDTISRQGGDEFVVVMPDCPGPNAASKTANKIHEQLNLPFVVGGQEVRVTASIGIALYPDDGSDFETLIKKCDIAMYHAKESGRAVHRFFADDQDRHSAERLQMETELRRALESDELVLHFQPQIDVATRKVIGAEALVRWKHPVKGMVPPGRFIPLAEETGLVVPLDQWVMAHACREARRWQIEGLPPLTVSVNVSALQFRQRDVVRRVAAALDDSGLAGEWLEIELTESVLVQDVDEVVQTVDQLKALGVKLAIDDFGTGYSSLAYLKRFDVDKLKIDQSFVRGGAPEDAAIVQAVIQLGESLNLRTIAEGAETAEQVQELRDKGCLEVQGYYFSKPLPAEEFVAFYRQSLESGVALQEVPSA